MNSSIKTYISKWAFMLFLMVLISSCDNDEIIADEQLIGQWELDFTVIGNSIELRPMSGVALYKFNRDKTFIKTYDDSSYREEGTFKYKEKSRTLSFNYKIYSFNYKTYTNEVSDTKSLDLQIEKISNKELILKVEYNDTNSWGEFAEYKFIHYLKK